MNITEIDNKFDGVADRAYAWSSRTHAPAPWPEFNKNAINVSKIELECRPKDYSIDFNDGKISIDWMTQEECVNHDMFDDEIKRCFFKNFGYDSDIHIHLYDRDGYDDFKYVLNA